MPQVHIWTGYLHKLTGKFVNATLIIATGVGSVVAIRNRCNGQLTANVPELKFISALFEHTS